MRGRNQNDLLFDFSSPKNEVADATLGHQYAPILLWAEVQTHSRVSIRFLGGVYMMEYCHLGVIQDGLPSEPV